MKTNVFGECNFLFRSTGSVGLVQINTFDIWGSPAVQNHQNLASLDHGRQKSIFF